MLDMCTYEYKLLSLKGNVPPEELFMDAYVEEVFESEDVGSFINQNIT